jgi:hypothetical protein
LLGGSGDMSSSSAFGGGVYSCGVALSDDVAASVVGGCGVLVPGDGDHWWLVNCTREMVSMAEDVPVR